MIKINRTIKEILDYLKKEEENISEHTRNANIKAINGLREEKSYYEAGPVEDPGVRLLGGSEKYKIIKKEFLKAIAGDKKFKSFFADVLGTLKKYLPEDVAFIVALHIIAAANNKDSSLLNERNISKILLEIGLSLSDEERDNMKAILKITKEEMAA